MIDHPPASRHFRVSFEGLGLCGSAYSWNLGQGFWVRAGRKGRGFSIRNTRQLFSERYGYVKSYRIGFGLRISGLRRTT